MSAFILILTVVIGDPETGPVHEFVVDLGLTHEDCEARRQQFRSLWSQDPNLGMSCHPDLAQ